MFPRNVVHQSESTTPGADLFKVTSHSTLKDQSGGLKWTPLLGLAVFTSKWDARPVISLGQPWTAFDRTCAFHSLRLRHWPRGRVSYALRTLVCSLYIVIVTLMVLVHRRMGSGRALGPNAAQQAMQVGFISRLYEDNTDICFLHSMVYSRKALRNSL